MSASVSWLSKADKNINPEEERKKEIWKKIRDMKISIDTENKLLN